MVALPNPKRFPDPGRDLHMSYHTAELYQTIKRHYKYFLKLSIIFHRLVSLDVYTLSLCNKLQKHFQTHPDIPTKFLQTQKYEF